MTIDILGIQTAARESLAQLQQADRDLRDEHKAESRLKASLERARSTVDEAIENMRAVIDREHEIFIREQGGSIVSAFSSYLTGDTRHKRPTLPILPGDQLDLRRLCGLDPDRVKANFEDVIRSCADKCSDLALPERIEAIKQCDVRIQEIERRHTRLVDEAAEAGITLELLPVVKERRQQEAHTQKQGELRRQQQADAEDRINTSPMAKRSRRIGRFSMPESNRVQ